MPHQRDPNQWSRALVSIIAVVAICGTIATVVHYFRVY